MPRKEFIIRYGYKMFYIPSHPYSTKAGYVFEHRLVMEEFLNRFLKKDELIHHKNKIKSDNNIDNLEILSNSEHVKKHRMLVGWSEKYSKCMECGTTKVRHHSFGLCNNCYMNKRNLIKRAQCK